MIWRRIMEFGIIAAYFVVIIYGFAGNSVLLISLPLLFLAGVFLISKPHIFLAATASLAFSGLRMPFLPPRAELFYLMITSFACYVLVTHLIKQGTNILGPTEKKWALAFGALLVGVMLARGFGSRFTGSALEGGGAYFGILGSLTFFVLADQVSLDSKTMRRLILAMYVLGCLPTLAHFILIRSHGATYMQYMFLRPPALLGSGYGFSGSWRLESGAEWLFMAFPFMYFKKPFSWKAIPLTVTCLSISLMIVGMTGHRMGIITILLLLAGLLLMSSKSERFSGFILIVSMAIVMVAVALTADDLPFSVQRTLSLLPGASITTEARIDAESSSAWRVDMWERALREIPDYLLLGKGLAYDQRRMSEITYLGLRDRDWGILTSSYHNGILSLLIVTGIPGLLLGAAFIASCLAHFWKETKREWNDPLSFRIFKWLWVFFASQVITYFTVYGDIQSSFPYFFIYAGLILMTIRSDSKSEEKEHL